MFLMNNVPDRRHSPILRRLCSSPSKRPGLQQISLKEHVDSGTRLASKLRRFLIALTYSVFLGARFTAHLFFVALITRDLAAWHPFGQVRMQTRLITRVRLFLGILLLDPIAIGNPSGISASEESRRGKGQLIDNGSALSPERRKSAANIKAGFQVAR